MQKQDQSAHGCQGAKQLGPPNQPSHGLYMNRMNRKKHACDPSRLKSKKPPGQLRDGKRCRGMQQTIPQMINPRPIAMKPVFNRKSHACQRPVKLIRRTRHIVPRPKLRP